MKLRIVIVNYNVRFFLAQCLESVRAAAEKAAPHEVEVVVVDNCSVDGSAEMVAKRFPDVTYIQNKENVGFSRANNQAMRTCNAEYVLLLNPDTLIEEDTLVKCIQFMDAHPECGGLGVRMIDGNGKFLRESKRGLPTPWVAFYKIFGLSVLFPKSPVFSRYHMGHLDEYQTHPVEILAGAFMMMRMDLLHKIGYLDEDYFMYGEDIDLSHRIRLAGYENYYFPETSIIHYKGESTKKSSINYVFVFYRAMIIFARKHFSKSHAGLFSALIHLAIYVRAGAAIASRIIRHTALPLWDFGVLYAGMMQQKIYWENNHRYIKGGEYPDAYDWYYVPSYIAIWLISIYFSGGYHRKHQIAPIFRGVGLGTLIILAGYSLLPEHLRMSRALILLGALWAVIALGFTRWLWKQIQQRRGGMATEDEPMAIIGSPAEATRVLDLLKKFNPQIQFRGFIGIQRGDATNQLGELAHLPEIVRIHGLRELVFCGEDLTTSQIIGAMRRMEDQPVCFKIAPRDARFVIGSQSIHSADDLLTVQIDQLRQSPMGKLKRGFDLLLAVVLGLMSPLLIAINHPVHFFQNWFQVLRGAKTWVGFTSAEQRSSDRSGVLSAADAFAFDPQQLREMAEGIDLNYARNYSLWKDIKIVFSNLHRLDR